MNIGEKIRDIRKSKKLSQIEVSHKAGIAVNSLRLYEAGKRQPNVRQLQAIADALDVSVSYFFNMEKIHEVFQEMTEQFQRELPIRSLFYTAMLDSAAQQSISNSAVSLSNEGTHYNQLGVWFHALSHKEQEIFINTFYSFFGKCLELNEAGMQRAADILDLITENREYTKKEWESSNEKED